MLSGSVTKVFGPDLAEGEPRVLSLKRQFGAERSHRLLPQVTGSADNVMKSSSPPSSRLALLGRVYSALWKMNPSHQGRAQEIVLENVTEQTRELLSLLLVFLNEVPSHVVPVTVSWFFRGED